MLRILLFTESGQGGLPWRCGSAVGASLWRRPDLPQALLLRHPLQEAGRGADARGRRRRVRPGSRFLSRGHRVDTHGEHDDGRGYAVHGRFLGRPPVHNRSVRARAHRRVGCQVRNRSLCRRVLQFRVAHPSALLFMWTQVCSPGHSIVVQQMFRGRCRLLFWFSILACAGCCPS